MRNSGRYWLISGTKSLSVVQRSKQATFKVQRSTIIPVHLHCPGPLLSTLHPHAQPTSATFALDTYSSRIPGGLVTTPSKRGYLRRSMGGGGGVVTGLDSRPRVSPFHKSRKCQANGLVCPHDGARY